MDQLQKVLAFLPTLSLYQRRQLDRALPLLKWLAGIGLAVQINKLLNTWALNHWYLRRQGVPWDWSGNKEVAIVTGGSSGFGHLIVKGLAPKMKVAVIDVQDMPSDLRALSSVKFYKCDITSATSVSETATAIRADLGTPSILINNAGVAQAHNILETSEMWLLKLFRVNMLSHFTLINEFLPDMLKQKKGHIIGIASMASFLSGAGLADYNATKAGVLALHEALNQELKYRYVNGNTIQTSVVHPMYARTPLIKSFEASLEREKTDVISPSDVADAVVKQVLRGTSAQLFVPNYAWLLSGFRGWPHWMQEMLRDSLAKNTVT